MFSCIILAAGESKRFGSPKAITKFQNNTIIEQILLTLIASDIDKLVVVLGAHHNDTKPFILKHTKVRVVYNKDYKFGQTSSFQAGLKVLDPRCEGVFALPVDFPCIKTATFNRLCQETKTHKDHLIFIPTYQDKKGHPPLFLKALFAPLLELDHAQGINSVIHRYPDQLRLVVSDDPGVVMAFNTPEELAVIKKQIGGK